jgi:triosephosphate isomerase
VGAQNIWAESGAFTGELSPDMVKDLGLSWVMIGHSERRHTVTHESEELLGKKLRAALNAGFSVTYCVGETLDERQSGNTFEVLLRQMQTVAKNVHNDDEWGKIVIAYEPVWAIGTGQVATPDQAQEAHRWLREWVSKNINTGVADGLRIQYGGSVKGSNARELAQQPDIDGFLVGGASLKAEFIDIVQSFL